MDDPAVHGVVVNSRYVTDKKITNDEIEKKLSLVAKKIPQQCFYISEWGKFNALNEAFYNHYQEYSIPDLGKNPRIFYR